MRRVVYVARGEKSGLYKIGLTHCEWERVRSLAAWLCEPVTIIAMFGGVLRDERAAQRRFAQYLTAHPVTGRMTRELFDDRDGVIAAWAATLPPARRSAQPPRPIDPVKLARIVEKRRATRIRREAHVRAMFAARAA